MNMTKKTETVAVEETVTSVGLDVANQSNDNWTRQAAIELALTFHKNNGGMHQAQQVVGTAALFLNFILGETK
jgi:hypothetical protein